MSLLNFCLFCFSQPPYTHFFLCFPKVPNPSFSVMFGTEIHTLPYFKYYDSVCLFKGRNTGNNVKVEAVALKNTIENLVAYPVFLGRTPS